MCIDICFAVSILTQHLSDPKPSHFFYGQESTTLSARDKVIKFVLILGEVLPTLVAFSYASFANDQIDRKTMGG